MTTVVDFRALRSEADAVRSPADAPCRSHALRDGAATDAEIILLPLAWISQIRQLPPRKRLKRRFALRQPVLAPAEPSPMGARISTSVSSIAGEIGKLS
jgi:hypothetical protein